VRQSAGGPARKEIVRSGFLSFDVRKRLTEVISREIVLLRPTCIERCSTKQGINRESPIIAVPEGTTLIPPSEGLGTTNSRTMGT
jgi:hypothetical protein